MQPMPPMEMVMPDAPAPASEDRCIRILLRFAMVHGLAFGSRQFRLWASRFRVCCHMAPKQRWLYRRIPSSASCCATCCYWAALKEPPILQVKFLGIAHTH